MANAQLGSGCLLEGRNCIAKDELAGIEHTLHRFKQFLSQGLVLALKIEHGYGLVWDRDHGFMVSACLGGDLVTVGT